MAGLQRSATTFRRSGSSGLVWDERFLLADEDGGGGATGEGRAAAAPLRPAELRYSRSRSVGSAGAPLRRCGRGGAGDAAAAANDDDDSKRKLADGGDVEHKGQEDRKKRPEEAPAGKNEFRTRDVAPAADPPSPRVSGCCCGGTPRSIFFRGSGAGVSPARRASWPRKRQQ